MFKKILAIVATLLLGAGASFVAIAAPASAHTGDLNATAVCNTTTGQYDVTYTLTIASTSLVGSTYWRTGTTSFEGTPSSNTGLTSGPVASTGAGVYTLGTISLPGTSTKAPWAYAFTTWTDGYTKGSDGGDIALGGTCTIPDVPVTVVLTYMQDCPVDTTNTWRVRNPSGSNIAISWHNASNTQSGTHTATPGDTFFTTPRGSETMIISWGGSGTGVVAGSTTKAAGNDLSATDPSCYTPDPQVSFELGQCYPNGTEPNRFSSKNLYIVLHNTSSVSVTFHVVGAADVTGPNPSADIVRTLAPGEKVTVETTPIWDQGGGYTVEFTSQGYTIPNGQIVVPAFVGCLDGNPGDPTHTNQQCVGGELVGGSITVELLEGFTYTITGPNSFNWVSGTVATVDGLAPGTYEVTVEAAPGYVLTGPDKWPYEVIIEKQTNCKEPTLTGSTAAGICEAGAPYILYDVTLTDPDKQATTFVASLILTDGVNTETIVLGPLVNNKLSGEVLWPGAAVDSNGFPTSWPGWEQDSGGLWVQTANNFGWTRDLTTVIISVNPQVVVNLTYPDASPACFGPDLPPYALVTPTVSQTQPTCTAAGTYTLGELDPGTISWTANGDPKLIGTYPVASGQVTLVATPTDPLDGLADWTNPRVLTFTPPSDAECDLQLTTLALTGAGSTVAISLAGGLILLGFGGLLMFARNRREV